MTSWAEKDGRSRDTWRDLLWGSELCPKHKLVALAIASFMSKESRAFPKYETLAERCTMGRSTVIRAVRDLQEGGWVKVSRADHPGPSGGTSNIYEPDWPDDLAPPEHCRAKASTSSPGLMRGRPTGHLSDQEATANW